MNVRFTNIISLSQTEKNYRLIMMKSYKQHSSESNSSVVGPMMKGSPWSSSPLRGQTRTSAKNILNVTTNAVDEALVTIHPRNHNDIDNGDVATSDGTTAVFPAISHSSTGIFSLVDPVPIHPFGIQEVTENQVPLSATWGDLKDHNTNTDLIQWVFTTPKNGSVARQTGEEDCESLDHHEDDASYDRANLSSAGSTPSATTSQRETWELLQYRAERGNCLVPHNWMRNKKLASWVKRQRYQYRLWCTKQHSTLNKERIEILNKVGFVWSSHGALWDEKFNELKVFSNQHGHCNVPSRYSENKQLSIWIRSQRRQYKLMCQQQQQRTGGSICHHHQDGGAGGGARKKSHQSYMTSDRVERLQSLGFVFDPRNLSQTKRG